MRRNTIDAPNGEPRQLANLASLLSKTGEILTEDNPAGQGAALRAARRIALVGCIGAGKSTLACTLGEKLGLEVFHLDRLWWQGGGYRIIGPETFLACSSQCRVRAVSPAPLRPAKGGKRSPALLSEGSEGKAVKTRVHLDMYGGKERYGRKVARLEIVGARKLCFSDDRGAPWWTMSDIEGNEFCVDLDLRSCVVEPVQRARCEGGS